MGKTRQSVGLKKTRRGLLDNFKEQIDGAAHFLLEHMAKQIQAQREYGQVMCVITSGTTHSA